MNTTAIDPLEIAIPIISHAVVFAVALAACWTRAQWHRRKGQEEGRREIEDLYRARLEQAVRDSAPCVPAALMQDLCGGSAPSPEQAARSAAADLRAALPH